ncbi:MAG: NAD(P)H:quinone oxidoreductase [Rhodospirillaceae bacterium]|nr:NAD(P)H:quinone oxidoreductase [Rhodospirillaceae bacterium]MYB12681.1 NAD(P)H:quinone oxidoreductase [Rhodospirillaceae bacterium]MYI50335.1 NAD(P)H:quinone oxidoreductase [Rhodospirillaceae bacterium]
MSGPRILVLFHSTGGATWKMAQAVAGGAAEAGAAVTLKQVPEIAEAPAIQGPDYEAKRASFAGVPVAEPADLAACDGLALGTPVHFGSMSGALRVFLDRTAAMWFDGALIGKPATVFAGAGSGGGRESAILSLWALLGTHGMTIVPLGLRAAEVMDLSTVHGGSPLGAGTVTRGPGDRPSREELAMARVQGAALAETAAALARGG